MESKKFKCDNCSMFFNKKHHLTNHLNRKIMCKSVFYPNSEIETIDDLKTLFGEMKVEISILTQHVKQQTEQINLMNKIIGNLIEITKKIEIHGNENTVNNNSNNNNNNINLFINYNPNGIKTLPNPYLKPDLSPFVENIIKILRECLYKNEIKCFYPRFVEEIYIKNHKNHSIFNLDYEKYFAVFNEKYSMDTTKGWIISRQVFEHLKEAFTSFFEENRSNQEIIKMFDDDMYSIAKERTEYFNFKKAKELILGDCLNPADAIISSIESILNKTKVLINHADDELIKKLNILKTNVADFLNNDRIHPSNRPECIENQYKKD